MTEKHARTVEFEATVGQQGSLSIPESVLESLGVVEGGKLHVRVTGKGTAAQLKRTGVTNEEIDRIAAMQLETPEQVVKFLLSEGLLRGSDRFRRAVKARGSRR
jgi:bifunctional DNA-binding transcriptional regulator/antitoxin component of YhaV-PrlF toxin-antitoxin module